MRRLTSDAGATAVTHGDDTHLPLEGTDAVFDLPDELAEHLLGLAGWRETTDDDLPDDQADDVDDETPAPRPRRRRTPAK